MGMNSPKRIVFVMLLLALVIVGGCSKDDEEGLTKRAEKGDVSAMIKLSEIMRSKGNEDKAMFYLGEAAAAGSEQALSRLQEAADQGIEMAIIELHAFYISKGQKKEALDMYYEAAKANPQSHAFIAGVFHLFDLKEYEGKNEDENKKRGLECLLLAGDHGEKFVYLLLCDMVADGFIPRPDESDFARWEKLAGSASELDIRLLAGHLSDFSEDSIGTHQEVWRKYVEKWKTKAAQLPKSRPSILPTPFDRGK